VPIIPQDRLDHTLADRPLELNAATLSGLSQSKDPGQTVLYLAYGSNLCYETFQGKRGIRPVAQVNVLVPELRLTFDLPGVPYLEPCFANSGPRDPSNPSQTDPAPALSETSPLIRDAPDYHKDRWKKGMVGVVYEVTLPDYAHIIATEGGGTAYQDVLVTCYPLTETDTVPEHPNTPPFKAHTLFAPAVAPSKPGDPPRKDGGRFQRPDTSYAQASARYMKLLTDGAEEHGLPQDYKNYLYDIRPYTITTRRQGFGKIVFTALWLPLFIMLLSLQGGFANDKGRSPKWLSLLSDFISRSVWLSYDGFFKKVFGDGERTL
ncbi:uncharacterized protein K452DRAFT_192455, partial [Aplosporella prunicola CBS 121167]